MYLCMFDDIKRGEGDNPTVGLILCAEKDEVVALYSILHESQQIFASKYMLYLPTEESEKRLRASATKFKPDKQAKRQIARPRHKSYVRTNSEASASSDLLTSPLYPNLT